MHYLLGLDNGGTMTKAALFDENGTPVASASRQTPLSTPSAGREERDMEELWQANAACIREVLERSGIDPGAVAGVGCTGHGKGAYLWGEDGPVCPAIASTDRRAEDIVRRFSADGTAAEVRRRTLQPPIACQPPLLLRWIKENAPQLLPRIRHVFSCKDYIRFRLTGEARSELTDASGTALLDPVTGQFDPALFALFGIAELADRLPPPCGAWERCGTVTEAAARQTGLRPGTPVAGGMFDIDACAVAAGVTDPDRLCMITGTWSINEYPSRTPVSDETTRSSLFCLPGYWLIEESSPTSAGDLEWLLNTCLKAEVAQARADGVRFYDRADALVAALPPQDSRVVFLPFLYGSNTAVHDAAFVGLSNAHGSADLLRAVYEGVTYAHRMHLSRLLRFRRPPAAIRLTGGAARSAVWVQMFADVLGLPVEAVGMAQPGALGAAMAAAVAGGIWPSPQAAVRQMMPPVRTVLPDPAAAAVYEEKYARYLAVTERLGGI